VTALLIILAIGFAWSIGAHYTGAVMGMPHALRAIGAWPALEGVWIAAGHEGLGITMATGTADIIVAGIVGAASPVDPEPFRPDRAMPDMALAA